MPDVLTHRAESPESADEHRSLTTLVLDRETIRDLTPRHRVIEAIGKKKPKPTDPTQTWPECGDTTTAKPECPITTDPGTEGPDVQPPSG